MERLSPAAAAQLESRLISDQPGLHLAACLSTEILKNKQIIILIE